MSDFKEVRMKGLVFLICKMRGWHLCMCSMHVLQPEVQALPMQSGSRDSSAPEEDQPVVSELKEKSILFS